MWQNSSCNRIFHLDVAYVAMTIYTYCKRIFHITSIYFRCLRYFYTATMLEKYIWMFHNIHVASICFKWFQVFHSYVASASSECCKDKSRCCICFLQLILSVFRCFRRTLQVFQLFQTYVANVFI
jgi:hypothetical protein